ncbi:SANT/Myb_domain [Hexamita inflata]|uniref:SANT/Myb domain n=1 Tax=Hexamita inflata TaxID=28002 RepID=A0AA86PF03_9EUKA|nr:SANT/Myb domain [Hexamita inflata]
MNAFANELQMRSPKNETRLRYTSIPNRLLGLSGYKQRVELLTKNQRQIPCVQTPFLTINHSKSAFSQDTFLLLRELKSAYKQVSYFITSKDMQQLLLNILNHIKQSLRKQVCSTMYSDIQVKAYIILFPLQMESQKYKTWSREEKNKLQELYKLYKIEFKQYVPHFNDRSESQIKSFYYNTIFKNRAYDKQIQKTHKLKQTQIEVAVNSVKHIIKQKQLQKEEENTSIQCKQISAMQSIFQQSIQCKDDDSNINDNDCLFPTVKLE